MRWGAEADDKRMDLAMELVRVVLDKDGLEDRKVRSDVVAAAFKTQLPSRPKQAGDAEKWVDHAIELARLVQNDKLFVEAEKLKLLKDGLGKVESADEEKQRVIKEIVADAQQTQENKPEAALRAFADCVGRHGAGWEGVSRREDGEITAIDWKNQNLGGTVGDTLFHLPYLTALDLSGNDITGEMFVVMCHR